jgi:hypothetical protein
MTGAFGDLDQAATGASGTKAWTVSVKGAGTTATLALRPASSGSTYTKAGFGKEHG